MNTVRHVKMRIQEALTQEREKYEDDSITEWSEYDRGLADGWIEALEYVIGVLDEAIPAIEGWNKTQDEAIIGLHRVAIAQLEGGNVEKAIGVLSSTINQLRGMHIGDDE
tara:strand:+ start:166 stop:495 length:330 start_codon:yes stop_codon:yes gene_type:complete